MDSLLEPEDKLREEYLRAPWGDLGRSVTLGVVSLAGKFILTIMNTIHVDGLDSFTQHVTHRNPDNGLLTVCNHTR